jgi:UDP-N-acetylmuramoylalanine-D-glutamate ligase
MFEDIIKETPKSVSIIGAAKSGVAAAKYFLSRGVKVFISETCERIRLDNILRENQLNINVNSELLGTEAGGTHGKNIGKRTYHSFARRAE